jgi:high-affinity nickel-transport protein
VIAGVFVLTWVVALAIWRFGKIEQRWDRAAGKSSPTADPGPGGPESERLLARAPGGC